MSISDVNSNFFLYSIQTEMSNPHLFPGQKEPPGQVCHLFTKALSLTTKR